MPMALFSVRLLVMPRLIFCLDFPPELTLTDPATIHMSPLGCYAGFPHPASPKLNLLSPSAVMQNPIITWYPVDQAKLTVILGFLFPLVFPRQSAGLVDSSFPLPLLNYRA